MSDLNENRKVETPQQQEQAAPVSWKTKLADYLRKEPRDLPPMPKASRKRWGDFSEGTDEITRFVHYRHGPLPFRIRRLHFRLF